MGKKGADADKQAGSPWISWAFWHNVSEAAQKILAAALLAALHYGLELAFEHSLKDWPWLLRLGKTVSGGAFFVIYTVLIFEAVLVFLPPMDTVLALIGIKRGSISGPPGGGADPR